MMASSLHSVEELAPTSAAFFPSGQVVHAPTVRADALNEYAAHGSHGVVALLSWSVRPGSQSSQAVEPPTLNVPTGQSAHSIEPTSELKRPAGQSKHVSTSAPYWPAAHSVPACAWAPGAPRTTAATSHARRLCVCGRCDEIAVAAAAQSTVAEELRTIASGKRGMNVSSCGLKNTMSA